MSDASMQGVVDEAMERLVLVREEVADPRGRQERPHLLSSARSNAVMGCLCGCDDAEALQD